MKTKKSATWECAYDGTRKKLSDGRCAVCGRATRAESVADAKAWDKKFAGVGWKSESKHTPTPWHRNVSPAYKYPIYADKNGDSKGKDWIYIAAVLPGNPNSEADLDFIVRAVNAHEALLSGLRGVIARVNGEFDNPDLLKFGALGNTTDDILKIAKIALAEDK